MTETNEEFIEFLVSAGKQSLETQEHYIPTVTVQPEEGENVVAVLAVEGSPVDALANFLAEYVEVNRTPIASISFTSDSYMEKGQSQEELDERRARKGTSLAQRFNRGDPTVSECLMITICFADMSQRLINLPYIRSGSEGWGAKAVVGDGRGKVVWGEQQEIEVSKPTDVMGRVPTLLLGTIFMTHDPNLMEEYFAGHAAKRN